MVFNVQPPSAFLPQLKGIRTCSRNDLAVAIARLRDIYIHPQVRGSTRRRPFEFSISTRANLSHKPEVNDHEQLTLISLDSFERSFAIQWLTRFISISSELTFDSEDDVVWGVDILEEAASLLAVCAGVAASGNVERVFVFPFTHGNISHPQTHGEISTHVTDQQATMAPTFNKGYTQSDKSDGIRITLRDAPLESSDFSSVGAQTWGGSCVLAEMIAGHPQDFGILEDTISSSKNRSSFRALELGAGTGLASVVLGKVLERMRPFTPKLQSLEDPDPVEWRTQGPELDTVIATDFHPSVLANLGNNVENNFRSRVPSQSPQVVALPLDWSLIHNVSSLESHPPVSVAPHAECDPRNQSATIITPDDASLPSPFDRPFDLIIGADIIYEPLHARWVKSCVEKFLRKPDARIPYGSPHFPAQNCPISSATIHKDPAVFHLIIPLRRTHSLESRTVEEVFAMASEVLAARKVNSPLASPNLETHESAYRGIATKTDLFSAPVLAIFNREDIVCDAYSDAEKAEEVVYRYYRIGWV